MAAAPTLAARLLPAAGGGSLAGAGGLRTALPAVLPVLPAVAPRLPEPVQNTWDRVTEGAGRLWDSVNGSANRSTAGSPTPPTPTTTPTPRTTTTTGTGTGSGSGSGSGSGGGNQLRVGDGTPQGAVAANAYNKTVLGINTNFVGNAQPIAAAGRSSRGSGSGSGGAGAGAETVSTAPAPAPAATSSTGSSGSAGSSDWGASARQAVVEQARPVIEQAQQTVTRVQDAASNAYRELGNHADAAGDALEKIPGAGGAGGWLRNATGLGGDGTPNR